MTWRIPPIGFCAVCLVARGEEHAAFTLVKGTAVCAEHAHDLLDQMTAEA